MLLIDINIYFFPRQKIILINVDSFISSEWFSILDTALFLY